MMSVFISVRFNFFFVRCFQIWIQYPQPQYLRDICIMMRAHEALVESFEMETHTENIQIVIGNVYFQRLFTEKNDCNSKQQKKKNVESEREKNEGNNWINVFSLWSIFERFYYCTAVYFICCCSKPIYLNRKQLNDYIYVPYTNDNKFLKFHTGYFLTGLVVLS